MFERFELDGSVTTKDGQMFVGGTGLHSGRAARVLVPHAHGFVSHPVKGAQGIIGFLHGDAEQPVLFGYAAPGGTPDIGQGGSVLYDAHGGVVSVIDGNIRHVGSTRIEGDLHVAGTITNDGDVVSAGVHTDSIGGHV